VEKCGLYGLRRDPLQSGRVPFWHHAYFLLDEYRLNSCRKVGSSAVLQCAVVSRKIMCGHAGTHAECGRYLQLHSHRLVEVLNVPTTTKGGEGDAETGRAAHVEF